MTDTTFLSGKTRSRRLPLIAALAAGQTLAGTAAAHVTANVTEARAGERIEIALQIGHGCDGNPTTALRVAIPSGIEDVQPAPKDGWQASVGDGEFGWTGGELPDHHHEEFVFAATLAADASGRIALPIVQICGDRQLRWIDDDQGSDSPAPLIRILPPR